MNTWFMNLTLARKLVMVLLLVGLLPMIIISVISSVVSTKQLEQQAFDQLDAVKNIKAAALNVTLSRFTAKLSPWLTRLW